MFKRPKPQPQTTHQAPKVKRDSIESDYGTLIYGHGFEVELEPDEVRLHLIGSNLEQFKGICSDTDIELVYELVKDTETFFQDTHKVVARENGRASILEDKIGNKYYLNIDVILHKETFSISGVISNLHHITQCSLDESKPTQQLVMLF